jgi:hypothetical protein
MTTTPNFGLNKPTVGGDRNVWGGKLNANADLIDRHLYQPDDVAALLADTQYTYTAGSAWTVTAGQYIRTASEGFNYKVAASGATDHDVPTAGGVKLYALPSANGALDIAQFGASPTPLFDNGPAFRAARAASERLGSVWAATPITFGFGTYEIRSAEGDGSAGVRFQKAPDLRGKGKLSTRFDWHTAVANRPLFRVDPSVPTANWGIKMRDFAIWGRVGSAAGGGIVVEMPFPSASFGFTIEDVRVVGCYDGITTSNVGGTTVYGCVIRNCSVSEIINLGKGFNIGGAYMEVDNCEAYPSFDGTGETARAFFLTAGWSKFRNLRAAGPVYADAAFSELDITIEGQASTCAHNANAAVQVVKMKKLRVNLVGARKTSETLPRYGVNLQDSNYLIEYLGCLDASGYSSPITPLLAFNSLGRSTLLFAEASGVGVLKPEDDLECGLDPTQGNKLQIVNGGTWTNYGEWTSTYNPGSIAAGASEVTTVTCAGLRNATTPLAVQFSQIDADIDVSAKYLSATQVQVRFSNRGASPVDLAEGTITVRALVDVASTP